MAGGPAAPEGGRPFRTRQGHGRRASASDFAATAEPLQGPAAAHIRLKLLIRVVPHPDCGGNCAQVALAAGMKRDRNTSKSGLLQQIQAASVDEFVALGFTRPAMDLGRL